MENTKSFLPTSPSPSAKKKKTGPADVELLPRDLLRNLPQLLCDVRIFGEIRGRSDHRWTVESEALGDQVVTVFQGHILKHSFPY